MTNNGTIVEYPLICKYSMIAILNVYGIKGTHENNDDA
jgi:hypothetical protein